jgi:hypothetical protein
VVSFPGRDPYRNQFEYEVEALRRVSVVRVVDHLFLFKRSEREVLVLPGDVERQPGAPAGEPVLHRMLGLDERCIIEPPQPLLQPMTTPGVKRDEVREIVAQMKPREGLGLALFEQLWSEWLVDTLTGLGGALVDLSALPADDLELVDPVRSAARARPRRAEAGAMSPSAWRAAPLRSP